MTKERELLEETLLFLDEFEYPTIVEEIRAFLDAETEDEPVAWEVTFNRGTGTDKLIVRTRDRAEREVKSSLIISVEPLYFHPPRPEPARKPLSDVEIADIYYRGTCFEKGYLSAFAEGFRQAERHYRIGVDDNG